jgi:hypothetical protein
VDGAENTAKEIRVLRVFLEFNQILIEARKVLMTFDQKLPNCFLILQVCVVHDPLSIHPLCGCPAVTPVAVALASV